MNVLMELTCEVFIWVFFHNHARFVTFFPNFVVYIYPNLYKDTVR